MHPLFPYIAGALVCLVFIGLSCAVSAALTFRDAVNAWQSSAEARFVLAHEKLQDEIGAVRQLAGELKDEGHRRDVALERQASELMQHRLSAPPPRMFSQAPPDRGRRPVQTSEDWDDGDGRATVMRPSQPPPLPAFERPAYMSR